MHFIFEQPKYIPFIFLTIQINLPLKTMKRIAKKTNNFIFAFKKLANLLQINCKE